MTDPAGDMETLTGATARLRLAGYDEDWAARDGVLSCGTCATSYDPAEVTVDEVVRFEGPSDPADEAILFALSGPCDHRGLYALAYGPDTSAADVAILQALRRAAG